MRTRVCVVGALACLVAGSPAEADVSKAWAAAKDNLPAHTQFVVAIDVAAIYKSPLYGKALEMFRGIDREFGKLHAAIKSSCGWDPFSVIEGIVIAGDAKAEDAVAFLQLTIDRTKASSCFQSVAKTVSNGAITVKQDGAYTTASKGKSDTVYFPWVGPSVVMVSIRPDRKDKVDAWFNQKGFARSKVAGIAGKLDSKAVIAGALGVDKPFEASVPITAAHGSLLYGGGKVTAAAVATATDGAAAARLAAMFNDELQRDLKRDRTPAVVKTIMRAITVAAAGAELSMKATVTEKDFGDALVEATKKKKTESSASGDGDAEQAVATMDMYSKKMCACKDKACADKVNEDLTKWATEMAKNPRVNSSKPSPDLAKRSAEIMTRYTECMTKAMMAGSQRP
jgi:hypothetical protein